MELPKIVAGAHTAVQAVRCTPVLCGAAGHLTVASLMSDGTGGQQSKGVKRMRSECEDGHQRDTNGKEQPQVVAGEGGGITHIPRAYRRARFEYVWGCCRGSRRDDNFLRELMYLSCLFRLQ